MAATWHPVTVEDVVQETPRDRTLTFRVPAGAEAEFRFRPGQFLTLRDPAWNDKIQRAYSISSSPGQAGTLSITVRDMGRTGEHLYHLAPGARLHAVAPRGAFVLDVPPGAPLAMFGGGSGVAPFRAFVRSLRESGARDAVVLVSSAREPQELVFHEEFVRTAREAPWFRYVPTVTRPPDGAAWTGRRGRVDAALVREAVGDPARAVVYACGPNEFVDAVVLLAASAGVPREHLRRERWG